MEPLSCRGYINRAVVQRHEPGFGCSYGNVYENLHMEPNARSTEQREMPAVIVRGGENDKHLISEHTPLLFYFFYPSTHCTFKFLNVWLVF